LYCKQCQVEGFIGLEYDESVDCSDDAHVHHAFVFAYLQLIYPETAFPWASPPTVAVVALPYWHV
jgi:hypothetical protein